MFKGGSYIRMQVYINEMFTVYLSMITLSMYAKIDMPLFELSKIERVTKCFVSIASQYSMRKTACHVINSTMVDMHAFLFNCTVAIRASDSMTSCS